MAKLYLEVTNQTLVVHSDIERIVENSLNYLEYEIINKTDDWDSFVKKIVVTYDNDSWEHSYPSVEEERVIHPGAIHAPGFTISVVGTKTEDKNGEAVVIGRIPTNSVTIKVWPSGSINGDNVQHDFPGEPADFETQFNELKNQVGLNTTDISELKKTSDTTLLEKVERVEEQINVLNTSISTLDTKTSELATEISSLNTDVSDLTTMFSDVEEDVTTLETNILELNTKISKLEIETTIENNIFVVKYKNLE